MENKKVLIGVASGIIAGIVINLAWSAIAGFDGTSLMYWEEWLMLIVMYAAPIIIGIVLGSWWEDLWKILLFPLLGGIAASVIAFLIALVVTMFRTGDIWIAIVGTLLFMALVAPVSKVLVIFFE